MNRRDILRWIGSSSSLAALGQEQVPLFHTGATLVEVYFTVLDSKGRYVSGLLRESFRILEDGQPVEMLSFEPAGSSLCCAVLMDLTGSMEKDLPALRNAIVGMVEQLREEDQVGVFAFNTTLQMLQDFTADKKSAMTAVLRTRASGATALFDSISQTARLLNRRQGKKALVVFTDGNDNTSMLNLESAVTRLKKDGMPVHAVAQGDALRNRQLMNTLEYLSRASGGQCYRIRKREDFQEVFAGVSREMKHSYMASYRPSERTDRKWRAIQVSVNGVPGARIRAKEGYFPD